MNERTEKKRRQRREKIDRAMTMGAQMLLDGLEVETIRDLKAIVDAARRVERVYRGLERDENDGEFALWNELDLINELYELGKALGTRG